jgi:transcriptional regulator with XRE-family HTH domain
MVSNVNQLIAARVRDLRARRGMTLVSLAERSGVSRSMISLVERGETSPTAVVLEKLATGLGVMLASLFEAPTAAADPVSRRSDQVEWRDPASGYLRRNVSPPGFPSVIQVVEVTFPPGQRVAYESGARDQITHQQIWVLHGRIEVLLGDDRYDLKAGDCLAMILDRPIAYFNPTARTARYAVIIAASPATNR